MNYILTTKTEAELCHYGVLGMKWGRRKNRPSADPSYVKAHSKKDVKYMSDAELRERNNRLNMEMQYRNMTKTKSKGKKAIDAFTSTATTIAAVTAAYGTYKKVGRPLVDKVLSMSKQAWVL